MSNELGAIHHRDRIDADLRRLGRTVHRRTRPGARGVGGVSTLTGREREVAELIHAHATNREIANELFLSTKTVETHVRNIFNKLGVTSRAEIARALAADQAS
jgi:DNA-binding NarL/FixJ family response regulator